MVRTEKEGNFIIRILFFWEAMLINDHFKSIFFELLIITHKLCLANKEKINIELLGLTFF